MLVDLYNGRKKGRGGWVGSLMYVFIFLLCSAQAKIQHYNASDKQEQQGWKALIADF